MNVWRVRVLAAGSVGLAFAVPVCGQAPSGDSLLAAGRLTSAESAYYAAVRAHPRDPESRRQLGRFLAQRGAVRVGAVLLEEARSFGGDAPTIARDLVPLYRALGDYHALATLPSSPLGEGERAQAVWLVEHPTTVAMADSVIIAYRPSSDGPLVGRITLRIDGKSVEAVVDATRSGIVVDPHASEVPRRRFRARADQSIPAVADTVQIGAVTIANAPVLVERLPERIDGVVGIDVLQRFGATFDPRSGRVVLRAAGAVSAALPGRRVPTLTTPAGVRVLQTGRFLAMGTQEFAAVLRTRRWTLDARRGAIVIDD